MRPILIVPLLAMIGALVSPLAASAQTAAPVPAASAAPAGGSHHGHHHRRHKSFVHALEALNLTSAQKAQVTSFRDQEKKANLNADPSTKKANALKMRQQVEGILTPDQSAQLATQMHHSASHTAGSTAPVPAPVMSP